MNKFQFKDLAKLINPNSIYKDVQLERNVLNILIVDDEQQRLGVDYLNENTFFDIRNRELFSLIKNEKAKFKNKSITFNYEDIASFLENPEIKQQYKNIDDYYLNVVLSSGLANSKNFKDYSDRLIELEQMRLFEAFSLRKIPEFLKDKNIKFDDISKELNAFFNLNLSTTSGVGQFKRIDELMNDYSNQLQEMKERPEQGKILSYFPEIDEITQGFKPGQLIIIAARPSVGKTAFSLNLAQRISYENLEKNRVGKNVAFISLEMTSNELLSRTISSVMKIPLNKLQNPFQFTENDIEKLNTFNSSFLPKMKLQFDDTPKCKLKEIIWKIKKLNKNLKGQLDVVFIDYLGLIDASENSRNRTEQVSIISRALKTLALEEKITVVALSQLNRVVEQRENNTPQLHDLRDSGSVEQDADIVIFLNKIKDPNSFNNDVSKVNLTVAKNRNGKLGNTTLYYKGEFVCFQTKKLLKKNQMIKEQTKQNQIETQKQIQNEETISQEQTL